MEDRAAIAAEGLVKRFGEVRALAGVDIELAGGGVLGLLGPNGAGKTTTVRILATLMARTADLALRRPTLDDAFLALTGQPLAEPARKGPAHLASRDADASAGD